MGRRPTEVANRAPLNRERTLQVAMVIADDEGLVGSPGTELEFAL